MIYSEKADVQLSLLFSQFYSPCILDHVRYSYPSAVNIRLYFSIYFPFSFSLAYIPFTGFLWFPLESFSFLKTSYYFFPRTLVGTKPPRVSHDGTVLSDFAFVCEGHFVRMQLFPPGRWRCHSIVSLLPLLLQKCQPLVILSLLSLCPSWGVSLRLWVWAVLLWCVSASSSGLCCLGNTALCTCDLSLMIRLRKFSASSKSSFPRPSPPKTPATRLTFHSSTVSGVVFCIFLVSASAWLSSTNQSSQNLILSSVL